MKLVSAITFRTMIMFLSLLLLLVGCMKSSLQNESQENVGTVERERMEVTILSPKAPSLLPALVAAEQESSSLRIHVQTWDTLEHLLAALQGGETNFIAAPLNLGANVAAQGFPLQLVHVNTWGSMFLVSLSPEVTEMTDLANKKVYIPGQGGPPEILTRYVLKEHGVLEEVEFVYSSVPEIMQLLASEKIEFAVLPEPVLSGLRVQRGDLIEIIDYEKVWQAMFNESLPQTGMFVNRQWAEKNPEAVEQFQKAYEEAVSITISEPSKAISVSVEVFGLPEAILAEAMNNIHLQFVKAVDAKPQVERYFQLLIQEAPDSIGGKLPDADFYYGL